MGLRACSLFYIPTADLLTVHFEMLAFPGLLFSTLLSKSLEKSAAECDITQQLNRMNDRICCYNLICFVENWWFMRTQTAVGNMSRKALPSLLLLLALIVVSAALIVVSAALIVVSTESSMSSQTTGQVFRSEDFIVGNYLIRLLQSPFSRPIINCKLKLSAVTNSATKKFRLTTFIPWFAL